MSRSFPFFPFSCSFFWQMLHHSSCSSAGAFGFGCATSHWTGHVAGQEGRFEWLRKLTRHREKIWDLGILQQTSNTWHREKVENERNLRTESNGHIEEVRPQAIFRTATVSVDQIKVPKLF